MSIMKIIDNTNNRKYAFVSLHMEYDVQNNDAPVQNQTMFYYRLYGLAFFVCVDVALR